jgi:hypothetical protein
VQRPEPLQERAVVLTDDPAPTSVKRKIRSG